MLQDTKCHRLHCNPPSCHSSSIHKNTCTHRQHRRLLHQAELAWSTCHTSHRHPFQESRHLGLGTGLAPHRRRGFHPCSPTSTALFETEVWLAHALMGMWAHPRSHAPHLRLRHVATHWPWPKQLCGAEDVWSYCSLGVALDWALQQSCWLGRRRLAASGTRLILTPDCWDTKKDWEQRPHGSHGRRSCSGFWNGQNEILGFECSCWQPLENVTRKN